MIGVCCTFPFRIYNKEKSYKFLNIKDLVASQLLHLNFLSVFAKFSLSFWIFQLGLAGVLKSQ